MKTSTLDKTFTIRQALRALRWILFASVLVYAGLIFYNAWVIKMSGISVAQMRYKNFPERCQKIVDIHRGGVGGTPFEGLQDRTIKRDVMSLIGDPECWGHAIRAGIDAKPSDGGRVSQANVRVIFFAADPLNSEKTHKVATVHVEYHD